MTGWAGDPGDDEGRGRLTVQVAGGDGEPERLLTLLRDGGAPGGLLVREWSSTGGAASREYAVEARALLDTLEDAVRRGRRVSLELYRVRRWLDGADV